MGLGHLGGRWGQGTASLGCFVRPTGRRRSITRAEPARTVVLLPGEPVFPCQGGFPTSSWEFWRCRQEQRCPVRPRHGQMVRGALCGHPASWSCHISRSIFGSEAPRRLQPAPQPCYAVPSSSSVAEEPPADFQGPARQDRGLALPSGALEMLEQQDELVVGWGWPRDRAHGERVASAAAQQAQGSVPRAEQRPCWKGAGLFMCFRHNSNTEPPPDKRLAI